MILLADSRISDRLEELQRNRAPADGICKTRGDSAYFVLGMVTTYHKGDNLTEREKLENYVYKVIRESIEWNYGTTAALFNYLTNLDKLQIMNSLKTLKVYTVATILRNCHVILYGGQTSNYFNIGRDDMPTLEQYLGQL